MTYIVTFKIGDHHTLTPKFVTRKFPQYLAGNLMTRQMFKELVLAEYPNDTVSIVHVDQA